MRSKKGQNIGFESMVILAFTVFIVMALAYYMSEEITGNYAVTQLAGTINDLETTINRVHNLGLWNKETITVTIPSGVTYVDVSNRSMTVHFGNQQITKKFNFDVIGIVPSSPGRYEVGVTSVREDLVKVGDGPYITHIYPICLDDRFPVNLHVYGFELDNTTLIVRYPNYSVGGYGKPFPTHYTLYNGTPTYLIGNYSIASPQEIITTITDDIPHVFYINPPDDPFHWYVQDWETNATSNNATFQMNVNCSQFY